MSSFNPDNQYRCTIIRGKAKTSLDDLLPRYAEIIQDICPCSKEEFDSEFDKKLQKILNVQPKTIANHRTEIAGKLFGMYLISQEDFVYPSDRTLKIIEDGDQPSFFKEICLKFQFPNGMDKPQTIQDRMENSIRFRPFSFILKLLTIAEGNEYYLTKDELGYYVLNCLEVLQGNVSPQIVYEKIIEHRGRGIKNEVPSGSHNKQHINEQIMLLELANLIRINDSTIFLNTLERKSIDYIESFWSKGIGFDIYQCPMDNVEQRVKLKFDWQVYYSKMDAESIDIFSTSVEAIQFNPSEKDVQPKSTGVDKIALGNDGENYIFEYEKKRVSQYDNRLTNKVQLVGHIRGLGYDIQSIFADNSKCSEFVYYIEVKSTKRVTEPDQTVSDGWIDAVTLTRNEWVAAEQHLGSFSIYRVYFTPSKVVVYIINNPFEKSEEGSIKCTPMNYRMDFSQESISSTFEGVTH
jgi:hypothetical protein